MAARWIGLAEAGSQDALDAAMRVHEPGSELAFATSARDLRMRVRGSSPRVGAAVGPVQGDVSSLNLAAAIVRDGMAREVVLATHGRSEDLLERAGAAGIAHVLDLDATHGAVPSVPDDPGAGHDVVSGAPDDLVARFGAVPGAPDGLGALDEPAFLVGKGDAMLWEDGRSLPWPPLRLEAVPMVEEPPTPGASGPCDSRAESPEAGSASLAIVCGDEEAADPCPESRGSGTSHATPAPDRPADGRHAPIVSFVSGRGGVGKTAVVAAMAWAAASWGMRVAVCDLDLSCGNLYSCFGASGPADLGSIPAAGALDEATIAECGREVAKGVTLWGPCERPEMSETVGPKVERVLEGLSAQSDLVLVDTSSTLTDAVAQAIQQCDRLVLVVDDRPGSAASQTRLAALAVRLGVARTRIARLANRCGPRGKGEPLINRADVGLETARPLRVLDGGAEVTDCLGEGKVGDLFDLGSKFADSAAESLAKLLAELGRLPEHEGARRLAGRRQERARWSFGRRREAM